MRLDTTLYPIYPEWNFLLLSIRLVHFRLKGCWVVVLMYIQILKQWRT